MISIRKFLVKSCVLSLLVASAVAAPGQASISETGKIYNIHVLGNGVVLFRHAGTRGTVPTCGQTEAVRWAFDGSTPQGQARLALLLTAYGAGKSVKVFGLGNCNVWGDTESVDYIVTSD